MRSLPTLSLRASTSRAACLGLALTLAALSPGCWATPLSRSHNDPFASPYPDEIAPPTITAQEEACARDPINSCRQLECVQQADCAEGMVCRDSLCVKPAASTLPDRPAPKLGDDQQAPYPAQANFPPR